MVRDDSPKSAAKVEVVMQGEAEVLRQFLTKSQWFNFTNKNLGARCWGESLQAQRKRAPHGLPEAPFLTVSNNKPQTKCPSHLLPVHLSIHPPDSLTLYGLFLPTDCWLGLLSCG